MRRLFIFSLWALPLAGCATTSFAPPIVNMDRELKATGTQTFLYAVCTPKEVGSAGGISPNVDGALKLINNYILTYSCQQDRAAEGRQFFEVPGFLASAGGAIAAAFGAPAAVAIGTGAAGAVLGQGKSYYAPKDKAKVLGDALRALHCIENEAVGIDGPTLTAISDVQQSAASGALEPPVSTPGITGAQGGASQSGPSVTVPYERTYYNLISTALWSVRGIVSDRLSNAGKEFDASGVLAEMEKFKKEAADKESQAGTPETAARPITGAAAPPATAPATTVRPDGTIAPDTSAAGIRASTFAAAKRQVELIGDQQVGQTVIQLKSLKPKLDACVVQAKL